MARIGVVHDSKLSQNHCGKTQTRSPFAAYRLKPLHALQQDNASQRRGNS